MGLLFVFLDGVGLGPAGDHNPLARHPTPRLQALLSGPLTLEHVGQEDGVVLQALDATLGIPGLPQSATGQTSLFTGANAAVLVGGHLSAHPGPRLRDLIAARSLLKRAVARGYRATFANGYSAWYWQRVEAGEQRHSASTLTALAAGLPLRTEADVREGQALFWDVTHAFVRTWVPEVPPRTPEEAAQILLGLTRQHDLVLYESFLWDLAGHGRVPLPEADAVALLDGLLGALAEGLGPGDTLMVTSDHGNFEDARRRIHTANPVPLLAVGASSACFQEVGSLVEVAGAVLRALEACPPQRNGAGGAP
ncbi:MAG: metalloenzyme [Anaerolineae bacterium]